jgi:hypothetical protein
MIEQGGTVAGKAKEIWRLNALVKNGIQAGEEYFLEGAEEFNDRKMELKINKGDLQTIVVLNRGVVNGAYGKWIERALPNFNIPLWQWNNFSDSQGFASTELGKVTHDALYKNNPPTKPEDWENFNQTETKIKISFKTAKSMVQVLASVMEVLDSEASGLTLNKDRNAYYEHVFDKDKKLKCIGSLLSQMAEQRFPVNQNKLLNLKLRQKINEPDAVTAKFLLAQTR